MLDAPPRYPRTKFRSRTAVQQDLEKLIGGLRANAEHGLHLGCGGVILPGLINCDLFDPRADRKVGLTDLSEFGDATVDYIEANHVIEHLSFSEFDQTIREMARVMRTGGRLVVSCPDFRALVYRWFKRRDRRWSQTISMVYGSQEHEGMFHKSGYTRERLVELLAGVGFRTEFAYTPYPHRTTPSLCVIAVRGS